LSVALNQTVQYDDTTHTKITLGGDPTAPAVTITNLANGEVSATSSDAVNGSQLFAAAENTAQALGGNTTVNADGTLSTSYTFKNGDTFNSVGDALYNLDSTLYDITTGGGIKYFHTNSTLDDSSATGTDAVAIGGNAQATGNNAVALGSGSVAGEDNTVSVGAPGSERRITNVAAGTNDTDAVNVSQLNSSIANIVADVVTYDDTNHTSVTLGDGTTPVKVKNVANGEVASASTDAVNGSQLYAAAADTAKALGGNTTVNADGTLNTSYMFKDGDTYTSVGDALYNLDGRVTQNTSDINTINNTLNNITTGGGIKYFHANSVLVDSSATGVNAVAIGGNAQATAINSVALGTNSVADRPNTISVGNATDTRQITNVAAGTQDNDAVNLSQLKQAGLINGDGTSKTAVTYDNKADGTTDYSNITLGNSVAGGTVIHNIGDGVAGTDAVNVNQMNAAISQVTNIAVAGGNPLFAADGDRTSEVAVASGTHATAMGANANASADNSVALGANSVADRVNTVSVGSAGNERQITNVSNGTQDTDAVNVRQLNLTAAQAQSYTDSRIAGVQGQINNVASTAYGGIAAAMAAAGLPQPTAPGKTMVAIAGARYASGSGAALGVSYVTQDNRWVVKVSGNTSNSGNVGFTVGAGHQW
jgi:trimeric autotransporter adhesin